MTALCRNLLAQRTDWPPALTLGPLGRFPERVVQFGEGNFLRAFADWMLDVLNAHGAFRGSVVVVQPIREGRAEALQAQDGLYTVVMRGMHGGAAVESRRLITSVSRALDAYAHWPDLVRLFRQPDLRFVISNTTEAGIAYMAEPMPHGACPESFPAKITALLHERFQAFPGDPARGLVFLPCELIDRNGDTLRRCVLEHAAAWGLGQEFHRWISQAQHFLNTLVDRIVTGFPRDEFERFTQELGYEDCLLCAGEDFHLWVIEGPRRFAEEFPLHRAGLNVIWTDDLQPYRTRKVRLLNGAHTASVLAGFLAGLNTVQEVVNDAAMGPFLRQAVFDEILPTVPLPTEEKTGYARDVLARFSNPFVRHELLSIALNSVSKWKVRVLPSLRDYLKAQGSLPVRLSFSLAALIWFYRGTRASGTELTGRRDREPYPIRDAPAVLATFEMAWEEFGRQGRWPDLATRILGDASLWDEDLTAHAGLADYVATALHSLHTLGMRGAMMRR